MGINTLTRNDPWIVRQFNGFDGTPDSIGVDGNGAVVLIPGISPTIQQNPLIITDPGYPTSPTPFYAVNPMGSGGQVFGVESQEKAMPDMNVNGGGQGTGGEIGPAVLPQLQTMPSATTATMPTVTGTANAVLGTNGQVGTGPAAITPEWLNQRLPSIVNPAPLDMGIPGCGGGISGWVADNPVLAIVGLAALAYAVFGRGK